MPVKVISVFKASLPQATKVKWILEDNLNYEAEFKLHKQEQSVVYIPQDTWMETEIEIRKSELPETIIQTFKTQFAGYKIEEASQIEDSTHGKGFEVEIKKGEQTYEILFSESGAIIYK